MQITRFAAPLGARITGLDVRDLSAATFAQLNAAFVEHQVLVFPEQDLTEVQQMAFAERWGDLIQHPYAGLEAFPQIIELKNSGRRRDINQHWHSDMTFNPEPPKLTMLYAHEAPALGGETAFANQYLAYEDLSSGLKAVLHDLKAKHTAKGLADTYKADTDKAPQAEHPVLRTHDESGKRALYVCRAFTERFVGWSRRESVSLLNFLFEHSVQPEYQARHQWQAGDLVMWDNRCLLHFAVHDHGDEPRKIHRVQIAGPKPV